MLSKTFHLEEVLELQHLRDPVREREPRETCRSKIACVLSGSTAGRLRCIGRTSRAHIAESHFYQAFDWQMRLGGKCDFLLASTFDPVGSMMFLKLYVERESRTSVCTQAVADNYCTDDANKLRCYRVK